jgi:hypothetical protein
MRPRWHCCGLWCCASLVEPSAQQRQQEFPAGVMGTHSDERVPSLLCFQLLLHNPAVMSAAATLRQLKRQPATSTRGCARAANCSTLPPTCSVMRLMTRVTGRPLDTAGWKVSNLMYLQKTAAHWVGITRLIEQSCLCSIPTTATLTARATICRCHLHCSLHIHNSWPPLLTLTPALPPTVSSSCFSSCCIPCSRRELLTLPSHCVLKQHQLLAKSRVHDTNVFRNQGPGICTPLLARFATSTYGMT